MIRKHVLLSLTLCTALALFAVTAYAATDNFFAGKTVRIMVAASPGGGFDAYSRLLARHMPRHIPGNPSIIVQNRPEPVPASPPTTSTTRPNPTG